MRYIVGIDLGTTNSCVAYVDRHQQGQLIQNFRIPQLTKAGTIEKKPTLPSFCYLFSENEWKESDLRLPWKKHPQDIIGTMAKEAGAKTPTKLVQSAKSWLCHSGIDRKAPILPFDAADASQRISPVEASGRYLNFIREAWNYEMAQQDVEAELEHQEIILTVPASFDEVARSLTIEAAKKIGLNKLTLLEEPQAAFYSWIASHQKEWQNYFQPHDLILVCDIGGGTTDFSLIQVEKKGEEYSFQRMAVGNHLLLGGDNMDRAIAYLIEQKLPEHFDASPVWPQILQQARKAKETLLNEEQDTYAVTLQGRGSKVIEGSLSAALDKKEVEGVLANGFFASYAWDEAIRLKKTEGFRSMGLPYEDDPSITKQLAFFLNHALEDKSFKPTHILFNGGALKPELFQNSLIQAIERWFTGKPLQQLKSISLDTAVARGAAYYGKVKLGEGVKIGGGSPRSYYVGVHTDQGEKALTVVPRGAEEGHQFHTEKQFFLKANTPVIFKMYSSHVRLYDSQGAMIDIDPLELQALPPIQTLLKYGKKGEEGELPVRMEILLTALGTLEMWLQSVKTDHRWKLDFQLYKPLVKNEKNTDQTFDQKILKNAEEILRHFYSSETANPSVLVDDLEKSLSLPKKGWPLSVLRNLADVLIKLAPLRRQSYEQEARWWNLLGFLMRPGYGYPLDEFRIKEIWKIVLSDFKTLKNKDVYLQALISLRRLAGGLNKGQQTQIAADLLVNYFKKDPRANEYLESEKTRLLGSFERLDIPTKIKIGEFILNNLQKKASKADLWALARIGARQLMYGALPNVIPKEICQKWLDQILTCKSLTDEQKKTLIKSLARKSDHRELNLSQAFLDKILAHFPDHEFSEVLEYALPFSQDEQEQLFGEDLPVGLRLDLKEQTL